MNMRRAGIFAFRAAAAAAVRKSGCFRHRQSLAAAADKFRAAETAEAVQRLDVEEPRQPVFRRRAVEEAPPADGDTASPRVDRRRAELARRANTVSATVISSRGSTRAMSDSSRSGGLFAAMELAGRNVDPGERQ
jgi:hypothetical protein